MLRERTPPGDLVSPRWEGGTRRGDGQEGSHQFEFVLLADKSKSGKEETAVSGSAGRLSRLGR